MRFAVLLVLLVVYMILHELVHGIAMKMCGTKKIKYGFTGMYAFAGSDDYYGKKPYIFIALAPVVLWGVVLAVVNPFVPAEWFWLVYLIQNIQYFRRGRGSVCYGKVFQAAKGYLDSGLWRGHARVFPKID